METRAFRIKLKARSRARATEWAAELNRRRSEALETLRDETVYLECFFVDQSGADDYLFGIMTAESFERSTEAVRSSTHPIDDYHKQFQRECWESVVRLEPLVQLDRLTELCEQPQSE